MKLKERLVWNQGVVVKVVTPTPTPTPTPTSTVTTILSYEQPTEPSENINSCKIKEVSNSRGMTGAGFPEWNSLTPRTGNVKWALIPIDFKDLPGESNFLLRVNEQMKLLSNWYSTVSEGKLNIEWVVNRSWVRLPGITSDYSISQSVNVNNAENGPKLFRAAMDAADPFFDFTNIQTVNFILPSGQTFLGESSQGFPWDKVIKEYATKEGAISSYSIAGKFFDVPQRQYWSYWAHEFGHAIGIAHIGSSRIWSDAHGTDLMGGQDGWARELSGWLRFYSGWLDSDQVYCANTQIWKDLNLSLVPLSGQEKGLKLVILPISPTKAILIESRRESKFSCHMPSNRNGVYVYIYDATLGHGNDFLIPVIPEGRTIEYSSNCIVAQTYNPIIYAGGSVRVNGFTISVLQSGNLDKIRIVKN